MKRGGPIQRKAPMRRSSLNPSQPSKANGVKPASKRKPGIPAAIRKAVTRRDNGVCARCMIAGRAVQIHHRLPVGRGGQHTLANCVLLCRPCHIDEVHAHPEESIAEGWTISGSPKDV